MGRVQRYKKIKAIDPASKKKRAVEDTIHDEAPDVYNNKVKNSIKRLKLQWEDDATREKLLQKEARREIRLKEKNGRTTKSDGSNPNVNVALEKSVEGKREDESMKAFKNRIRKETKMLLHTEIRKMTSTAQKKKLRLNERKRKREGKDTIASREADDEAELESFNARSDGYLRPSDLGNSSDTFRTRDSIGFNERVERPPDLKSLVSDRQKARVISSSSSSSSSPSSSAPPEMGGLVSPSSSSTPSSATTENKLHQEKFLQ